MLYFILTKCLDSILNVDPELVQPGSLWSGQRNERLRRVGNDGGVEGTSVDWREEAFKELDPDEFELLRMVRREEDRLRIYLDPEWLSEARHLMVDDPVRIVNVDDLEGATGRIRFKGRPDADRPGVLFGVELEGPFAGKGTSDGTFRKRKYFSCAVRDSAVFYSVKCVRRYDPTEQSYLSLDLRTSLSLAAPNERIVWTDGTMVTLNERVVWISDNGPQYGTIRWLGYLPELDYSPYAGVEFDNPIGKGSGRYKGKQLFTCRKGHSSLVPLIGLIRAADYNERRRPDSGSTTASFPESTHSGVPSLGSETTATVSERQTTLRVGDRVEIRSVSRFGVIRWIGTSKSGTPVAGLEMDDEDPECYTTGSFEGHPKFTCQGHRAFFVGLEKCHPVTDPITRDRPVTELESGNLDRPVRDLE